MDKFDQRIDTYIGLSPDYARPVLWHLRRLLHRAAPQITETMKRGSPYFEYQGAVCHIVTNDLHCTIRFSKNASLPDPYGLFLKNKPATTGRFEKITSLDDLPGDEIVMEYVKNAVEANASDSKPPRATKKHKVLVPLMRLFMLS